MRGSGIPDVKTLWTFSILRRSRNIFLVFHGSLVLYTGIRLLLVLCWKNYHGFYERRIFCLVWKPPWIQFLGGGKRSIRSKRFKIVEAKEKIFF